MRKVKYKNYDVEKLIGKGNNDYLMNINKHKDFFQYFLQATFIFTKMITRWCLHSS